MPPSWPVNYPDFPCRQTPHPYAVFPPLHHDCQCPTSQLSYAEFHLDAGLSKKAGYRHLPPERQGRLGLQGKNVPARQRKVGLLSGSEIRQGLLTDPLWSFYLGLPVTSQHPSPHQLSVLLAMAHTQYVPAQLRGARMQDQSPPLQRPTGQYSKLHLRQKWGHHGTLVRNH